MNNIKIIVSFTIMDNWYNGQRLSKKEKLEKYTEEFLDIEVLENHIPKYGYDVDVEEIK